MDNKVVVTIKIPFAQWHCPLLLFEMIFIALLQERLALSLTFRQLNTLGLLKCL